MSTRETIHLHSTQEELDQAIRNEFRPAPIDGTVLGGTIGGRKLPGETGEVGTIGIKKAREDDRADLAHKLFGVALDRDEFSRRDHYWVDQEGLLFIEFNGDPLLAEKPLEMGVACWLVDDGRVVFLARTSAGARTVADLDRADAEARKRAEEEARADAAWLASQPRQPILLSDLDGQQPLSLRAAVRTFLAAGGTLETGNYGELALALPVQLVRQTSENEIMHGLLDAAARDAALNAATLIARAEKVMLAVLATKRKNADAIVDATPDKHVTLGGGVA
jgi:hypothetical protein